MGRRNEGNKESSSSANTHSSVVAEENEAPPQVNAVLHDYEDVAVEQNCSPEIDNYEQNCDYNDYYEPEDPPHYEGETFQLKLGDLMNEIRLNREEIQELREEKDKLRGEIEEVRDKEKNKLLKTNYHIIPLPDFKICVVKSLSNYNDFKYAECVYPKQKFTGEEKCDLDIYDFLYALTEAHKNCPLNEEDFTRVFTARLGSHALGIASTLLRRKVGIVMIFDQLYQTFNKNISPFKALDVLRIYDFPRSFNIAMVLAELTQLASICMRGGEGDETNLSISLNIQEGLKRSMPYNCFSLIYASLNQLRVEIGRQPNVNEIYSNLKRIEDTLDYELSKAHGHKFGAPRELFAIVKIDFHKKKEMPSYKSNARYMNNKRLYAITTEAVTKKPFKPAEKSSSAPRFGSQKPYSKQPVKGNRNDRPMCSFCGSFTHSAYNGCYSCLDNSLKLYSGPPAAENCKTCLSKLNKQFRHPMNYCPLRDHMLKMYKSGQAKPRGIFKSYLERIANEKKERK